MLALPYQSNRVLTHFLSSRHDKKELSDYVQELRTLLADMQLEPLPEAVQVTILTDDLRTGVARTEIFRVHSSTFEKTVDIDLNAELNFKVARYCI